MPGETEAAADAAAEKPAEATAKPTDTEIDVTISADAVPAAPAAATEEAGGAGAEKPAEEAAADATAGATAPADGEKDATAGGDAAPAAPTEEAAAAGAEKPAEATAAAAEGAEKDATAGADAVPAAPAAPTEEAADAGAEKPAAPADGAEKDAAEGTDVPAAAPTEESADAGAEKPTEATDVPKEGAETDATAGADAVPAAPAAPTEESTPFSMGDMFFFIPRSRETADAGAEKPTDGPTEATDATKEGAETDPTGTDAVPTAPTEDPSVVAAEEPAGKAEEDVDPATQEAIDKLSKGAGLLSAMSFFEKLTKRARDVDSLLCVGLDPHKAELEEDSAEGAFNFCSRLIEDSLPSKSTCPQQNIAVEGRSILETKDLVAAYKPNAAFFEAYGVEGWGALQRTLALIPKDIPIVFDAKRGDIGSTSEAYACSAYQTLNCDSVTVSPYLGSDGLQPFLKDPSRGAWVLCKTSNPGSQDIQALQLPSGEPLYVHVAKVCCLQWAKERNNAGLVESRMNIEVVGATDVEAMRAIRAAVPDVWFLSPGIGSDGWVAPRRPGNSSAHLARHFKGREPEEGCRSLPGGDQRTQGQAHGAILIPLSYHAGLDVFRVGTDLAGRLALPFNLGPGECVVAEFTDGLEAIPDTGLRSALQNWAEKMNGHVQELKSILSTARQRPRSHCQPS
eukprot:s423_g3.t1